MSSLLSKRGASKFLDIRSHQSLFQILVLLTNRYFSIKNLLFFDILSMDRYIYMKYLRLSSNTNSKEDKV